MVAAAQRLVGEDSLTTGVLYKGGRPPYTAHVHPVQSSLAEIEESFVL